MRLVYLEFKQEKLISRQPIETPAQLRKPDQVCEGQIVENHEENEYLLNHKSLGAFVVGHFLLFGAITACKYFFRFTLSATHYFNNRIISNCKCSRVLNLDQLQSELADFILLCFNFNV